MDFSSFSVEADIPYPEPLIPYPNPLEAKKLLNDYGGRDSETTSILQYAYQSYVLKKEHPDYSTVLGRIAVVEMRHHKILGSAIAAFGGFPVIGGRNTFWNGSYANYLTDLVKLLEADIRAEETAIANYGKCVSSLQSDSLKQVIERIMLDEEQHITVLREMLSHAKSGRSF